MSNVPVFEVNSEVELLWNEIMEAVQGVIRSGKFIMGPNVTAFEEEVAAYLGVKYAVALNSGTDALVIALKALGIGPGDEVITTPFTFFATAEAIGQVGATPIFVDVEECSYNLDPNKMEEKITSRTKAIMPVHLYGQAADMDEIRRLAAKYKLFVVEDVAQAFGGEYKGKKLGTLGDAGCFSFFPTKNLGAYGDGGLFVTQDEAVAQIARKLRTHGGINKYRNEMLGYNSRLDEIQAAILRVKLPHIDHWNENRRGIARKYDDQLHGISEIVVPAELPYAKHVYHQYTVRILNGRRDEFQRHLSELGISTMVYYPTPVHRLPVYQPLNGKSELHLPVSETLADEVLSLPIWPLMHPEKQERAIRSIREAAGLR
ncbi:DegT/DnrJ/EryC1/StrS family aminotransferase [Cohnella suwonensis]|uniref:DegT/DnrJ/EryC1/StrS family aminotransferase n=1 Tax=Cohnella suwonensis TaxID=696072 RepID=A0ABW0LWL8_9BACL